MKKGFFVLFTVILVISMSLVHADWFFSSTLVGGSSASETGSRGHIIKTFNDNISITAINKTNLDSATIIHLRFTETGGDITNFTCTGNLCINNSAYVLQKFKTYYLMKDSNGASYTIKYSGGNLPFSTPINNTYFSWFGGANGGNNTAGYGIEWLNVTNRSEIIIPPINIVINKFNITPTTATELTNLTVTINVTNSINGTLFCYDETGTIYNEFIDGISYNVSRINKPLLHVYNNVTCNITLLNDTLNNSVLSNTVFISQSYRPQSNINILSNYANYTNNSIYALTNVLNLTCNGYLYENVTQITSNTTYNYTTNLTSFFRFEESTASANAIDEFNGYNLTAQNNPPQITGKEGFTRNITSNKYFSRENSVYLMGTTDYTYSFWVYFVSNDTTSPYIMGNGYKQNTGGTLCGSRATVIKHSDGYYVSSISLVDQDTGNDHWEIYASVGAKVGEWEYYTITRQYYNATASNFSIYINGVKDENTHVKYYNGATFTEWNNTGIMKTINLNEACAGGFVLAGHNANANNFQLDNFAIYKGKALNYTEVLNMYNSNGNYTNTINTIDTVLVNVSSNSYDNIYTWYKNGVYNATGNTINNNIFLVNDTYTCNFNAINDTMNVSTNLNIGILQYTAPVIIDNATQNKSIILSGKTGNSTIKNIDIYFIQNITNYKNMTLNLFKNNNLIFTETTLNNNSFYNFTNETVITNLSMISFRVSNLDNIKNITIKYEDNTIVINRSFILSCSKYNSLFNITLGVSSLIYCDGILIGNYTNLNAGAGTPTLADPVTNLNNLFDKLESTCISTYSGSYRDACDGGHAKVISEVYFNQYNNIDIGNYSYNVSGFNTTGGVVNSNTYTLIIKNTPAQIIIPTITNPTLNSNLFTAIIGVCIGIMIVCGLVILIMPSMYLYAGAGILMCLIVILLTNLRVLF